MSAAFPPTQAPAATEYAGDEINALVLDPGSYSIRAGFAGEDVPKSVVPTSYGALPSGDHIYGDNAIHVPRAEMEIRNPYNPEGIVEDWDTAAKLWEYAITSRLTGTKQTPPSRNGLNETKDGEGDVDMGEAMDGTEEAEKPLAEHPLLVSEPSWNPARERQKTMEIAMEDWGAPAFFLAKTGQLAAYSQSKATALVVDIGAQNTSVTALWDGMVLNKSKPPCCIAFRFEDDTFISHDGRHSYGSDETTLDRVFALIYSFQTCYLRVKYRTLSDIHPGLQHSPLAGNYLNDQIRLMFSQSQPPVPFTPHYMVKTKTAVDANAPSAATYVQFAKPPTDSFRKLEEERVLTAFKESVVQTWPGPGRLESPSSQSGMTNAEYAKQLPAKPFEFPDGWNTVFGLDRFRIAESLFDHQAALTSPSSPKPSGEQTLPSLINRSLQAVDVDARPVLLNNIILTGAGSLIEKLPERLQADVQAMYPNPKVRVLANSSTVERKFGAWIGGSVLGSLGSFHQMWVSREEYSEFGSAIVEKRCK